MKAYLEPEEVARREQGATNLRDRLLVHLLFRLGCRVSELSALRPQDIDLERGTVTIVRLKQRLRLQCPGCGVHLGRAHRFCPGCGREVKEAVAKERVFPIGRRQAWKVVADCARRAGLPSLVNPESGQRHGVSPHRLRDAFAVHALKVDDSGEGMRLLQKHLA